MKHNAKPVERGERLGRLVCVGRLPNRFGALCYLWQCDCGGRREDTGHQVRYWLGRGIVVACRSCRNVSGALRRGVRQRRVAHRTFERMWEAIGSLYLDDVATMENFVRDCLVEGDEMETGAVVPGTLDLSPLVGIPVASLFDNQRHVFAAG